MSTKKQTPGEKLNEWLQKQGHSQAWLANVLGVSQPGVSNWVRGRSVPEEALRAALAELTGIAATEWLPAEQIEALGVLRGRVAAVAATLSTSKEPAARTKRETRKRRTAATRAAAVG